jgi:hypothetical protein
MSNRCIQSPLILARPFRQVSRSTQNRVGHCNWKSALILLNSEGYTEAEDCWVRLNGLSMHSSETRVNDSLHHASKSRTLASTGKCSSYVDKSCTARNRPAPHLFLLVLPAVLKNCFIVESLFLAIVWVPLSPRGEARTSAHSDIRKGPDGS